MLITKIGDLVIIKDIFWGKCGFAEIIINNLTAYSLRL